jgi:hypothetical protein
VSDLSDFARYVMKATGRTYTPAQLKAALNQAKETDQQGGALPKLPLGTLRAADLVTLPEDVESCNCSNCGFNEGGVCRHPNLDGQPVNRRNVCGYWDSEGTLRTWQKGP